MITTDPLQKFKQSLQDIADRQDLSPKSREILLKNAKQITFKVWKNWRKMNDLRY